MEYVAMDFPITSIMDALKELVILLLFTVSLRSVRFAAAHMKVELELCCSVICPDM